MSTAVINCQLSTITDDSGFEINKKILRLFFQRNYPIHHRYKSQTEESRRLCVCLDTLLIYGLNDTYQ